MQVISLISHKGGTGKSTLAMHFAVEAGRSGPKPVVLVDLDPQGSVHGWYQRRPLAEPDLVAADPHRLNVALETCREDGAELVIIDTAPHLESAAMAAARVSDLVVIPCRPAILDIEAIAATVALTQRAGRPAVLVLNASRPRGEREAMGARQALGAHGLPICPVPIVTRAALSTSLVGGHGVQELAPKSKAAGEIAAVWSWVEGFF